METVVLIVHLLLALALIGVVLMQRSEGGALGIGGGGGMFSARSAANALTRTTAVLGALFMVSSLVLAILAGVDKSGRSIFDDPEAAVESVTPTKDDTPVVPLAE